MAEERDNTGSEAQGEGVFVRAGCVIPSSALRFTFVRSSGPGGQNVNKRATQAQLRVFVSEIPISPAAGRRLRALAGSKLTDTDEIVLAADAHRSQRMNMAECVDRLQRLVLKALTPPKPRVKTKPTKASKERRLKAKSQKSERKASRRGLKDH
ncbi:MAG: alternative ribosome rescue aminoacyl-tRNA hydrolase ArfB [Phycisphaerales bacterium]